LRGSGGGPEDVSLFDLTTGELARCLLLDRVSDIAETLFGVDIAEVGVLQVTLSEASSNESFTVRLAVLSHLILVL